MNFRKISQLKVTVKKHFNIQFSINFYFTMDKYNYVFNFVLYLIYFVMKISIFITKKRKNLNILKS